jgi:hypothetical protein
MDYSAGAYKKEFTSSNSFGNPSGQSTKNTDYFHISKKFPSREITL